MDIQYLLWLQTIRSDFLDGILLFITDLVVSPIIYVVIAIMYWCFNKKAAMFMAMNISIGSMVNQTLKNTFCVYRPWIKNPDIVPVEGALENASGYSFPSGHTQVATSIFLSLTTMYKKKKWSIIVYLFMTFLIMFTRNYLGVHTPQDVIVSFIVATLIIFLNKKVLTWVDGGEKRDIFVAAFGAIASIILLVYLTNKPYPMDYKPDGSLLVDPSKAIEDCYVACGCVFGFFVGWILERRFIGFSTDVSVKIRILRAVAGIAFMLLYAGTLRGPLIALNALWGEFAFFAIAFILILFVYPAIFTRFEKVKPECC